MSIYQSAYSFISKSFQFEAVKRAKRKLRPLKWALFGKGGIYKIIDSVSELERSAGKDVRTVFDIGAADGEYAVTFAESFPRADIYCFEPQSGSYSLLEKKTKKYGSRAKLFKIGVFNKNEKAEFNLDLMRPDSSSLLPPEDKKQKLGTETVTLRRLDDFVAEHKIQHIDFMKIDVEGAEKEVIEGGLDTLKNRVDNLFVEISLSRKGKHSSNYIAVLSIIHACGFALIDISENENFFFSKLV